MSIYIHIFIYTHIYLYIYIYILQNFPGHAGYLLIFALGKLAAFALSVSLRFPGDTLEPVLIAGAFLGGAIGNLGTGLALQRWEKGGKKLGKRWKRLMFNIKKEKYGEHKRTEICLSYLRWRNWEKKTIYRCNVESNQRKYEQIPW